MGWHSQNLIIAAVILTIAISISKCEEERSRRLEALCSGTKRSKECQNILKSKSNWLDDKSIAGGMAELAIAKSKEIYDKIYQYYLDCEEDRLKAKYLSCAINYYDANCNLELARRILDFDEFPNVSDDLDEAEEELMNCRRELGDESFDTSRVEEIRLYLDMVRAAASRIPNDDDAEVEDLLKY